MSDHELDAWLRTLGSTSRQRIAVITNLLAHAIEDRMSSHDRAICRRALMRLGTSFYGQRLLRGARPRTQPSPHVLISD